MLLNPIFAKDYFWLQSYDFGNIILQYFQIPLYWVQYENKTEIIIFSFDNMILYSLVDAPPLINDSPLISKMKNRISPLMT